jgi:hypothetical protein
MFVSERQSCDGAKAVENRLLNAEVGVRTNMSLIDSALTTCVRSKIQHQRRLSSELPQPDILIAFFSSCFLASPVNYTL